MENLDNYLNHISTNNDKISFELENLKALYSKFFSIDNIFSNENGGKTRLNRQLYSENHEDIQKSIFNLKFFFDENLTLLQERLKQLLAKFNLLSNLKLDEFLIDDKNFLDLLEVEVQKEVINKEIKSKFFSDIQRVLKQKNRVQNLQYFINVFDTTILNRHIERFTIEELINSSLIFEVIDSYALQYEELKVFDNELKNFQNPNMKYTNLNDIDNLLELHKRKLDGYYYADTRYKISLDFETNLKLPKATILNLAYIKHIIYNLIEQSALDIIKKELKKGKILKMIFVNIEIHKHSLEISVRNNGFEIGDIYSLFMLNSENKTILEVKNLVNELNGELGIESLDDGMQYTVSLKI